MVLTRRRFGVEAGRTGGGESASLPGPEASEPLFAFRLESASMFTLHMSKKILRTSRFASLPQPPWPCGWPPGLTLARPRPELPVETDPSEVTGVADLMVPRNASCQALISRDSLIRIEDPAPTPSFLVRNHRSSDLTLGRRARPHDTCDPRSFSSPRSAVLRPEPRFSAPRTFDFKDSTSINNTVSKWIRRWKPYNGDATGIPGTVTFDPAARGRERGDRRHYVRFPCTSATRCSSSICSTTSGSMPPNTLNLLQSQRT